MPLVEQLSKVLKRNDKRVFRVNIGDVHLRDASEESFITEVQEKFEELGAIDVIHVDLLLMSFHKGLVALVDCLEVELAVPCCLLVRKD